MDANLVWLFGLLSDTELILVVTANHGSSCDWQSSSAFEIAGFIQVLST